jgi:hypothetical protein
MSVMFNGDQLEISAVLSDAESVERLIKVLEANKPLLPGKADNRRGRQLRRLVYSSSRSFSCITSASMLRGKSCIISQRAVNSCPIDARTTLHPALFA